MATGRVPTTANSPLTAKGDLFTYSTAPARLAVGNNGESLVADSSTSSGLRYQGNYAAGKNAIINGAFNVWQRGTSINLSNGVETYVADRYIAVTNFSAGTSSFSQQTFTPGTAPVSGYEGQYYGRLSCASGVTLWGMRQRIEDVRTFAGQTVTVSFWIKASAANASTTVALEQTFGTGGSATASTTVTGPSITTSWQRYSVTVANPSVSGKTIGSGSYLQLTIYSNSGLTASMTVDTWGWQVEASNTATAFQTATGTLQGELAACQRYYQRIDTSTASFVGHNRSTVSCDFTFPLKVTMRTAPTQSYTLGSAYLQVGAVNVNATAIAQQDAPTTDISSFRASVASGLTAASASLFFGSSTIIQMSAEL